jgi:manganese efflux pump family protein
LLGRAFCESSGYAITQFQKPPSATAGLTRIFVLQTMFLALSLSADAFAAAIAKGARYPSMSLTRVAAIAFSFGALEGLAPLIGYILGKQFAGLIEGADHWIAFSILGFLGVRMIWGSFFPDEEGDTASAPTVAAVFATALGTSVDATAVGITLALFTQSLPTTLAAIGGVTFVMAFIGLRLGGIIGNRTGRWAEFLGGIGLIAIGSKILQAHLA